MNTQTVEPRPTRLSDDGKLRAARAIVADLLKEGLLEPDEADASAADLAKYGSNERDGYQLAKKLDNSAYWDCDMAMAEALDNAASYFHAEIEASEREWAERNNITPPLPVGARVAARWGGEEITGTIESIASHGVAQYVIRCDGSAKKGMPVVRFEDVRLSAPMLSAAAVAESMGAV